CQVPDLLTPDACPGGLDLSGIRVEMRATEDVVTTAADGSFRLPASPDDATVLRVAENDPVFRSSLVSFATPDGAASGLRVPMLLEEDYQALKGNVGFGEDVG